MPRYETRRRRPTRPPRRGHGALVLLSIAAVLASSGIISVRLIFGSEQNQAHTLTPGSPYRLVPGAGQAIIKENARPGTTDWQVADPPASIQIQAYAGATSVSPGQKLTFYVSTEKADVPYTVQIFRLGWYDGAGGRLLSKKDEIGQAQGYYNPGTQKLVGCSSCSHDLKTNLVEANWRPSFSITIPNDWVTGLYEAKLTDAHGSETAVSFEVRGNPDAAYIVVLADNTTEAYNEWGGYSLYYGPGGVVNTRATKVSFDRPALGWSYGFGNGLPYEIDAIRWMERQGYDLSYISSVDLDENPGQLLNHRAFISLGHDEYWSKAMRDGVENARDQGLGLAFMGGNSVYWQIRYEPDSRGVPDRTIVCYKSAKADPLYGKDDAVVTVRWRDPPVNRPENALIGIMFVDFANAPQAYPWRVSPAASSPLLNGTGLQPGQTYGCNLVGNEWDTEFNNRLTPSGLTILGASNVISRTHKKEISMTTYYIAPSGAFVFASGSIYWTYALDDLRIWNFEDVARILHAYPCLSQSRAVPGIQILMEHVMRELITDQHPDLAHN